ncbi:MAG: carboxylating nicotinate-nucleotide diphosphorylase [Desulfobacteraceae bacterium]|nr:carboxylating nicotinate-nucleotide diphosphorylase [Desulfobacteraceae bacterium]MBC2718880.1 carboxylating nicotinate-nucleotide diphosphorylase [Desulfobacteraceae bacterium]
MHSINHLIEIALEEDIGPGDITTENLIDKNLKGIGEVVAKEPLIIAGIDVARQVFEQLDPDIAFRPNFKDGDFIEKGKIVLEVEGKLRVLLMGERTALNFLQHLSGIATHVHSYMDSIANKNVRLVDTRKTTPGLRSLEKYAVRVGGAHNHRMGLYDGVLIKDNHIAVCGGIKKAIESIKDKLSHLVKIEVEVSDPDSIKQALEAGADVIMLDNMDIDQIKKAIKFINGKSVVEISGGVTTDSLNQLADTGADIISAGALTHSARSVDISMRIRSNNNSSRLLVYS